MVLNYIDYMLVPWETVVSTFQQYTTVQQVKLYMYL